MRCAATRPVNARPRNPSPAPAHGDLIDEASFQHEIRYAARELSRPDASTPQPRVGAIANSSSVSACRTLPRSPPWNAGAAATTFVP
jgi:hypothetical protein